MGFNIIQQLGLVVIQIGLANRILATQVPLQLGGYQTVYQTSNQISLTYTEADGSAYFWNLTCINSNNVQILSQTSTTNTLDISSSKTGTPGLCFVDITVKDTTDQLISSSSQSFRIISEDPTTYVDSENNLQNYFIRQPIYISAIPPIGSTQPQWNIICVKGNTEVFNQIYYRDKIKISAFAFDLNTNCTGKYTGYNSAGVQISLNIAFSILTYESITSYTKGFSPIFTDQQSINLALTIPILPFGPKPVFTTVCYKDRKLVYNLTTTKSSLSIAAGTFKIGTICTGNIKYSVYSLTFPIMIDEIPDRSSIELSDTETLTLLSEYNYTYNVSDNIKISINANSISATNVSFNVLCLNASNMALLNQTYNSDYFTIASDSLQNKTLCQTRISFFNTSNHAQGYFSFNITLYPPPQINTTNLTLNQTVNDTTNQTLNQTENQTINQTTNQTLNQTDNQTINQTNQTVNDTTNQTLNQTDNQTINQNTTNQTVNQTKNQTLNQTENQITNQTTNQTQNQSLNQTLNQTNQTLNQTVNQTIDQTLNQTLNQTQNQTQNQTVNQTQKFECDIGTYLLEAAEKCVQSCPVGYIINNDSNICTPYCDNNCTKCGDFQALYNGTCYNICPNNTIPFVQISTILQKQIPPNTAQQIKRRLRLKFLPNNTNMTILTYRELGIPQNITDSVQIQCNIVTAPIIKLPMFRSVFPPNVSIPIKVVFQSSQTPSTLINISCTQDNISTYYQNSIVNQSSFTIPSYTTKEGSKCTLNFTATNEFDTTSLVQTINIINVVNQIQLESLIITEDTEIQSNVDPLSVNVVELYMQLRQYIDAINEGQDDSLKILPIIRVFILIFGSNNQLENKIALPSSVENKTAARIYSYIIPPSTSQFKCRLSIQIIYNEFPEFELNAQSNLIKVLPQSLADIKQAVFNQTKTVDDIKQQDIGDIKNLLLTLQTALGKSTQKLSNDVLNENRQIDQEKYKQMKEAEKAAQVEQSINAKKAQLTNQQATPICNDSVCNGQGQCFVGNNQLACKCNDNYKGQFCAISNQDFANAVSLKSNIAAALLEKPVTAETVNQVADSITSLASDADTITEDTAAKMAQVIQAATDIFGKDVKPNTDQVLSFVDATDSILSVSQNKKSIQKINSASENTIKPTSEQIQQLKQAVINAIAATAKLINAIAINLNVTSKETQTIVSSNFKSQLGFINTTSSTGNLRRLQTTTYVSFESSSGGVSTLVKIPQTALSQYELNSISYQSQLWYVNNREVIDDSKNISSYIILSSLYNTESQESIDVTLNDKIIQVTIPLLVTGYANSTYKCLIWQTNNDGSQSWNDQLCTQTQANAISVTCSCSKLGEVSASQVINNDIFSDDEDKYYKTCSNALITNINQIFLLTLSLLFVVIAYN